MIDKGPRDEEELVTDGSLAEGEVRGFAATLSTDRTARVTQNAIAETPVDKAAVDRGIVTSIDPSVSIRTNTQSITNQKKSDRYWLFSSLDSPKSAIYEHTSVKKFEFFQNYQYFWNRPEKTNYFLTSMVELTDRDADNRVARCLLPNPVGDGGQWDMFVALIEKYGVVPKHAIPETGSSSNACAMNQTLQKLLCRGAHGIRRASPEGADPRVVKATMLERIYKVLAIHLGTPPQRSVWQ